MHELGPYARRNASISYCQTISYRQQCDRSRDEPKNRQAPPDPESYSRLFSGRNMPVNCSNLASSPQPRGDRITDYNTGRACSQARNSTLKQLDFKILTSAVNSATTQSEGVSMFFPRS